MPIERAGGLPAISVIVPSFNGERYLPEAIESALKQTVPPSEIILVDDGSTDGTAAVAARYPTVRYAYQENAGASNARNHGITLATGEFIAFLDHDDVFLPDRFERQLAHFARRPELDASFGMTENFWAPEHAAIGEQYTMGRGKTVPGMHQSTMFLRRATFQQYGLFPVDLRHGETLDWLLRARAAGLVTDLLPDVLVRRRLHESNVSRIHARRSVGEHLAIIKRELDRRRAQGDA